MCLLACSRHHSSLICLARSGSDQLDSVALTVSRTIFPLCFYVKLLDLPMGHVCPGALKSPWCHLWGTHPLDFILLQGQTQWRNSENVSSLF